MKYLIYLSMCLLCLSCSRKAAETQYPFEPQLKMIGGDTGNYTVPKATVFKMSGDYSNNVGVTLNADGTLTYYPAPSDLSANSVPVNLGNGWWLNRQGLSANSVFTKWTFDEYTALPKAPSREEIMQSIVPGATVTEFKQIPISITEALEDPSKCIFFCE